MKTLNMKWLMSIFQALMQCVDMGGGGCGSTRDSLLFLFVSTQLSAVQYVISHVYFSSI